MTASFRSKQSAAVVAHGLKQDGHAPISAMIEIADRCNEVCVHCYQVQGQKGEMSTDQIFGVIDELAEMGVLFLTISGGEPTLRHDFLEIIEHARRRKFAVKLFTNGLRIDAEMARRLGELALQEAQMSLYSHRADLHDWVTGVPGSFDKTVAAAKSLLAEGVSVVLKTPAMDLNAPEYESYIDFVSGLGADYMFDPHLDPREDGDRVTEGLRVSRTHYLRLKRDPRLRRLEPTSPQTPRSKPLDSGVCGACSGNVHIEPNGEMRPCTQLSVPVGHALEEGVRRSWEENESGLGIRHLTWADLHGCRDCDLRAYCGHCFANAIAERGDALGPYETACQQAVLEYGAAHDCAVETRPGRDGRQPTVGPFRRLGPTVFEALPDTMTARDERLAADLAWTRQAPSPSCGPDNTGSPGLVQIRRPSERKARWARPPRAAGSVSSTTLLHSRPSSGGRPVEEER